MGQCWFSYSYFCSLAYLCHQTPTACKQLQHPFRPSRHHTLSPKLHWSTPPLCHLWVIIDQQDEYHHLNRNLQCCKKVVKSVTLQFCHSSLTWAHNPCILKMIAVVRSYALVWTVSQPNFASNAVHIVQKNGSTTFPKCCIIQSNGSWKQNKKTS